MNKIALLFASMFIISTYSAQILNSTIDIGTNISHQNIFIYKDIERNDVVATFYDLKFYEFDQEKVQNNNIRIYFMKRNDYELQKGYISLSTYKQKFFDKKLHVNDEMYVYHVENIPVADSLRPIKSNRFMKSSNGSEMIVSVISEPSFSDEYIYLCDGDQRLDSILAPNRKWQDEDFKIVKHSISFHKSQGVFSLDKNYEKHFVFISNSKLIKSDFLLCNPQGEDESRSQSDILYFPKYGKNINPLYYAFGDTNASLFSNQVLNNKIKELAIDSDELIIKQSIIENIIYKDGDIQFDENGDYILEKKEMIGIYHFDGVNVKEIDVFELRETR